MWSESLFVARCDSVTPRSNPRLEKESGDTSWILRELMYFVLYSCAAHELPS